MTLHQYLTEYTQTLQKILEDHENETAIMAALEEAYSKEDMRFQWISKEVRSGVKKGIDNDDEKPKTEKSPMNKPVSRSD